jgi:hypothetical protein
VIVLACAILAVVFQVCKITKRLESDVRSLGQWGKTTVFVELENGRLNHLELCPRPSASSRLTNVISLISSILMGWSGFGWGVCAVSQFATSFPEPTFCDGLLCHYGICDIRSAVVSGLLHTYSWEFPAIRRPAQPIHTKRRLI